MRFSLFTAAIALTSALAAGARADAPAEKIDNLQPSAPEAAELWKNAPLDDAKKPVATQSQFVDTASAQFSLLSELRAWRGTFDGTGKMARRELLGGELAGTKAGLSLGNVAAPTLAGTAGGAGVAAHWGILEIGSTLRPRELDDALRDFDKAMTGEKPAATDAQNVSWLRAKPWSGKNGHLELTLAQAARDVAAGEAVSWRKGTFLGASGDVKLPLRWKLDGNWNRASLENAESKTTWNAKLGGPIVHPLGEAKAEIEWRETEAGFADLAQTDANGGALGGAKLTQDIKTNFLTGQLRLAATQRDRRNLETIKTGDAWENRDASGAADLKVRVTPNLSLRASGALGSAQVSRAADDFAATLQATPESLENATIREATQTQGGDVGAEWKLGGALSVAATIGNSQTLGWRDEPTKDWTPTDQSEENRIGFELNHQTSAGVVGAKYATRERDAGPDSLSDWRRLETVRLRAERSLFAGLKLKATVDLARDAESSWSDQDGVARRVEAQLQLSKRSRFDLNYRDGAALPGAWLSDPLSAPFRPASGSKWATGDREWGARINAGSAAGGNGLGLAFEYARQEQVSGDNDKWRVGLTWK